MVLALAFLVIGSFSLVFFYYQFYFVRDVSIEELDADPESYDGVRVRLRGYIIQTDYMFGPKYVLKGNETDIAEIPLGGKSVAENIDLEPYVSSIWNSRYDNYTKIRDVTVIITGYVHFIGLAIDLPTYLLEVETVNVSES